MLNENNFFKNFSFNSKEFNQNLKKTKIIFNSFKSDLKNSKIPPLQSYEKDYIFDFTQNIIYHLFKTIKVWVCNYTREIKRIMGK